MSLDDDYGLLSKKTKNTFEVILENEESRCNLLFDWFQNGWFQIGFKAKIKLGREKNGSLRLSPFGSVKLSVNSPFDDCESPFTFTFTFSGWVLDQQITDSRKRGASNHVA